MEFILCGILLEIVILFRNSFNLQLQIEYLDIPRDIPQTVPNKS